MSELVNTNDNRTVIRWKLLTSASTFVLTACISCAAVANAEDAERPTLWIEVGGQMENVSGQGDVFAPAFLAANPNSTVLWQGVTPLQAQKPSTFGFGEEGSISFQPEASDWIFSAAIRYGRSSNSRKVDHQTNRVGHFTNNFAGPTNCCNITTYANFADTQARRSESHAVLDFAAGKDVGLGLFGKDSSSTLSLGVRFAQFSSKAALSMRARPDLHVPYLILFTHDSPKYLHVPDPYFNSYYATGHASRSFRGVGPSLSWTGSVPFAGNEQDGEITLDWGANAALLFGKQKAKVQHRETAIYHPPTHPGTAQSFYNHPPRGIDVDRSVTVPNVGGSIGISWRVQDFKASVGYRYDTFLKAMDIGIDASKTSNLTFNGPYASISIGLGD